MSSLASVGQPLHFWPGSLEVGQTRINSQQPQPFHAVVVFAQPDGTVNIVGHDHLGKPFSRERCRLVDSSGDRPAGGISYATWPEVAF